MGYYTQYELDVKPAFDTEDDADLFTDQFEKTTDYALFANSKSNFVIEDVVKWYGHDAEMRVLSALYPDKLFTLHGVGEEPGDEWCKYYKNGKCQDANVKIVKTKDPFNEAELT